jgi:3-oxoacyl-[acyl-carrier-protein] synthase-1
MNSLAVCVDVGARSSVGLNAVQNGFLMHAQHPGVRTSPLADARGKPVTFCQLDTLAPELIGAQRSWELARPAWDECLEHAAPLLREARVEVHLSLSEFMRPEAEALVSLARAHAYRQLGEGLRLSFACQGPAGPALFLAEALPRLERGEVDAVVLWGIHSDYHPERIRALEGQRRLYTDENLNAVLPGEAAACVLMTTPLNARRLGRPVRARITGVASGQEEARFDNDVSAYEAAGLTVAVHRCLDQAGAKPGWWIADAAFEEFRVAELQAVMVRMSDRLAEPHWLELPSQRIGYAGGATLPFAIALNAEGWRRGWAPHERALLTAGSDDGLRAALTLAAHG